MAEDNNYILEDFFGAQSIIDPNIFALFFLVDTERITLFNLSCDKYRTSLGDDKCQFLKEYLLAVSEVYKKEIDKIPSVEMKTEYYIGKLVRFSTNPEMLYQEADRSEEYDIQGLHRFDYRPWTRVSVLSDFLPAEYRIIKELDYQSLEMKINFTKVLSNISLSPHGKGIEQAIRKVLLEDAKSKSRGVIESNVDKYLEDMLNDYIKSAEKESEKEPDSTCVVSTGVKGTTAKKRYLELKRKIHESVIGNDELVEALALALVSSERVRYDANNFNEESDYYPRQNILIVGGTGTGKSFTVRKAAKAAGREFIDINLADISAVGFVGKDLEATFETKAAGLSSDKFEHAVIFLDELDKVILNQSAKERDRSFDIVPELLKLIECETIPIKVGRDRRIEVLTRDIVFVLAGAFEEINNTILERLGWNNKIGFSINSNSSNKHKLNDDSILREITTSDFEKYGVSRQLLGRMNRIVITNPMNVEGYKRILMESSDSAFLKQKRLLKDAYGLDLHISKDAISTIASECEKMKVGARGLNSIINTVVSKGLAEALSQDDVTGMDIISDDDCGVRCDMKYTKKRKRKT